MLAAPGIEEKVDEADSPDSPENPDRPENPDAPYAPDAPELPNIPEVPEDPENHEDAEVDLWLKDGNANPAAAPIFDGIFIPNGGPNILLIAEFII